MTTLFEVAHFTERRLFFQHGEGTGRAAITFPSSVNLPLLKILSFNSLHRILHHFAHPHQSQSAPNHTAWVRHSISILTNISTQFLLQSVYVCVCVHVRVCVCMCVCVYSAIVFKKNLILYVNCVGRTML